MSSNGIFELRSNDLMFDKDWLCLLSGEIEMGLLERARIHRKIRLIESNVAIRVDFRCYGSKIYLSLSSSSSRV